MELSAQRHQNTNDALFESFYKDVWRKLIPEGLTEAEADFIEEVAELKQGDSVLDIMSGYGRHSVTLAKRGYRATAVDNLPSYINEINEIATTKQLSINTLLGDVTNMKFQGAFDASICMGNSFSTFDRARSVKLLMNINECLKTDGILIINTWMISEIAIKHFEAKTWLYADEFKYLLDNKYLFNPTRIETDHIVISEHGETQVLKGTDYIFSFAELEDMLSKTGFKMGEVFSTPRKRKYSFGDNRAYIVAVKQ